MYTAIIYRAAQNDCVTIGLRGYAPSKIDIALPRAAKKVIRHRFSERIDNVTRSRFAPPSGAATSLV
jgi:hypothetical protein